MRMRSRVYASGADGAGGPAVELEGVDGRASEEKARRRFVDPVTD